MNDFRQPPAGPRAKPLTIFFSAGEPSGDLHGANLIRELRLRQSNLECVGFGGPLMAEAGCRLHVDMTALAVMWFLRVILKLHIFWRHLSWLDREFRQHPPDAVVLIDFPGFNWWVARRAKRHGIPVFYFAPPQVWAWGRWRVKKMRAFVDHVLCSLPFEATWFAERGCNATFVGHPYFDEVRRQQFDAEFLSVMLRKPGRLVTILPGSRTQEVTQNLKWFLKAAQLVQREVPNARFAIASFKPLQADIARRMVAEVDVPVEIFLRKTPELIRLADCCMAVSGSVSLELLYQTKPTVVLYAISALAYRVQKHFRKVKYITLVNLLSTDELFPKDVTPYDPSQPDAERVLFPEYLTCEDRSRQIADHVIDWLKNEDRRVDLIDRLDQLKRRVGHGGASQSAALYILEALSARTVPTPRPHFTPGMFVASSGNPRPI